MVVLDASAMLALINGEEGAEVVEALLEQAVVSAVNLSEVAGKLVDRGVDGADARAALEALELDVRAFGAADAFQAAELRSSIPKNYALGDRACLALALSLGIPAVTADRDWGALQVRDLTVQVIR